MSFINLNWSFWTLTWQRMEESCFICVYICVCVWFLRRVSICGCGPGRSRSIVSPSRWGSLLAGGVCGGCPQSCWRCVTSGSTFIPVITPQSDCCGGKLCGVWWDTEFSCLTICEINSHSTGVKEVLHHRPQHGWVLLQHPPLSSSTICIIAAS